MNYISRYTAVTGNQAAADYNRINSDGAINKTPNMKDTKYERK